MIGSVALDHGTEGESQTIGREARLRGSDHCVGIPTVAVWRESKAGGALRVRLGYAAIAGLTGSFLGSKNNVEFSSGPSSSIIAKLKICKTLDAHGVSFIDQIGDDRSLPEER